VKYLATYLEHNIKLWRSHCSSYKIKTE